MWSSNRWQFFHLLMSVYYPYFRTILPKLLLSLFIPFSRRLFQRLFSMLSACIQERHMMCDRFYIRIPFAIFLWCFRCTQRWMISSICMVNISPSVYRSIVSISSLFLSDTRLSPCYSLRFPTTSFSYAHPQSDRGTVLALLDSHIFIDDPFPGFRKFYPSLLIRQKPFFVIIKISIQFPGLSLPYLLHHRFLYCPHRSGYTPTLIYFLLLQHLSDLILGHSISDLLFDLLVDMKPIQLIDGPWIISLFDPASSISVQDTLTDLICIIDLFNQCFSFLMERTAFLHPRQHLLIHKAAPLRTVRIPPLIHRENLHLLLWRLLMTRILHPQPYTIHLLKKNPDGSFPFRLVCFHLLYCVFLLFADPFPQLLDQVPDSSVANGLTAGIADDICADTIRSFCYCQGYLFCKVCGDQPDLFLCIA